ncbi:MAG: CRISPR-associated protein Cas5, partial [Immundisolibacter sp.]|uniref:CRISPR-associated protein Cas5 n=1 Tax=Immundisolibacter sp. TaxID=1934948 RepID=UPI003EE17989
MTTHTLEVWGDLACFTRPEMKVERFSYPVITPSAARGIFDAIYWDGKREQQG